LNIKPESLNLHYKTWEGAGRKVTNVGDSCVRNFGRVIFQMEPGEDFNFRCSCVFLSDRYIVYSLINLNIFNFDNFLNNLFELIYTSCFL